MLLVEPALRETSRELLAVRDQLLALSDLEIVAPCFWTGACPALARERDWCHDAAEVAGSPRVDFSYLVLRDRVAPDPGQPRYRVVSDPLPEKGRLKLYALRPDRPARVHTARPPRIARATPRSPISSAATSPASPAPPGPATACASRRRPPLRACLYERGLRRLALTPALI